MSSQCRRRGCTDRYGAGTSTHPVTESVSLLSGTVLGEVIWTTRPDALTDRVECRGPVALPPIRRRAAGRAIHRTW